MSRGQMPTALGHQPSAKRSSGVRIRPARAANNRYIAAMAERREALPEFPAMYAFSEPLRAWSEANERPDFQFLLYGQAAALNRVLSAADLVARLAEEARAIFAELRAEAR